jgi:hypothetical protein
MRYILAGGIWFALTLSSSAAKAEWTEVGRAGSGSVWLMDPDRITVHGNRVHAWVKIDASKDRSVNYRDGLRLYSSICSSKKIKLLSASDYDSYGKVIKSNDYSESYSDLGYRYVTPDSMGETILDISCAIGAIKDK